VIPAWIPVHDAPSDAQAKHKRSKSSKHSIPNYRACEKPELYGVWEEPKYQRGLGSKSRSDSTSTVAIHLSSMQRGRGQNYWASVGRGYDNLYDNEELVPRGSNKECNSSCPVPT
jgi:hypothetical protein